MDRRSAICGRDVIRMREALELLFRRGLLTWRGDEPRVMAVTHWESEQEPLPTVNRRKARSADRSRRYALIGQDFATQPCRSRRKRNASDRLICFATFDPRIRSHAPSRLHHATITFRHVRVTLSVTRDAFESGRKFLIIKWFHSQLSHSPSRHRKIR